MSLETTLSQSCKTKFPCLPVKIGRDHSRKNSLCFKKDIIKPFTQKWIQNHILDHLHFPIVYIPRSRSPDAVSLDHADGSRPSPTPPTNVLQRCRSRWVVSAFLGNTWDRSLLQTKSHGGYVSTGEKKTLNLT